MENEGSDAAMARGLHLPWALVSWMPGAGTELQRLPGDGESWSSPNTTQQGGWLRGWGAESRGQMHKEGVREDAPFLGGMETSTRL